MKKILITIQLAAVAFFASAQFEAGTIEINAGTGFGIYTAKSVEVPDSSDVAAAGLLNLTGHYAINEKMSVGGAFERSGFAGQDATTSASALTFKGSFQYRFVNSEKNQFGIQVQVGFSTIGMSGTSSIEFSGTKTEMTLDVSGGGMAIDFGIHYNHLFSESIGFFIDAGYGYYDYSNATIDFEITSTDTTTGAVTKASSSTPWGITMGGLNARTGLTIKL